MMPQLLHLHMSVNTDSRRIRARFGSGFVRIRGDSCGFARIFGGTEKTLIQKCIGIPMTWQNAGPKIKLSKPGTSDPFYNTKSEVGSSCGLGCMLPIVLEFYAPCVYRILCCSWFSWNLCGVGGCGRAGTGGKRYPCSLLAIPRASF